MLGKTLLLTLVACILSVAAQDAKPPVAEVREKCREELNLSMEQIEHLNLTRRLDTTDRNIKCFVKCMLTEFKIMNDEGVFTTDDEIIGMLKTRKYYPTCKGVTGTDLCDKAVNFQNCVVKQIKLEEGESE